MEIPPAEQSIARLVSDIHLIARQNQPVGVSLGRVMKAPPDLQIAWNGIILTRREIYIDQFLLSNYARKARGTIDIPNEKGNIRARTVTRRGGVGRPSYTYHNHKIRSDYKASAKGDYTESFQTADYGLEVGDVVAILPINDAQQFIVLAKLKYMG